MASKDYLLGRQKYTRPQAMLWSDSSGTLVDGLWVPTGYERTSDDTGLTQEQIDDSFLILSDHNRGEININTQRIEQRKRMINGTMRSYYNSDKLVINTSWSMLPSRAFGTKSNFDQNTGKSDYNDTGAEYTVDGGAGGVEMLKWYQDHTGPFWVYLAYDNYSKFGSDTNAYGHMTQYNQIVEMYIASFDYTIVKRGQSFVTSRNETTGIPTRIGGQDLWNISLSLEEV
jgi:hypothetical protein